ncbi:DUF6415 family natural product biosynthesis protein (plasmid) [Streptomyces hirsutus]|uniref:DUF6415 family natural product biosynthesis protein n=1 Tax=Streptomyces hirsutus TaxID=35620 RepID=UPI0038687E63|nr:DUF6415 family natural product biosynthesis protein [Streptomyces hirsutus]
MIAPGTVQRLTRPVPRWTPPLSGDELATVLDKIRTWQAFDGDALLNDVAAALDDVPPAEEDVEEIAQQLRSHLMRLVTIAIAAEAEQDATAAQLIEQARTLCAKDLPGNRWKAVGHLRRMGWAVNELLEQLVALRCLKEVA